MNHYERKQEFETIFGNDGDPAVVLADVVIKIGDVLAMIVGSDLADQAMTAVSSTLGGDEYWRDRIDGERYGLWSEWVFGERLFALAAYAQYGIDLYAEPDDSAGASEERVKSLIGDTEAFLAAVDLSAWLGEGRDTELEKFASMARARWALDHSEPLLAEDLAALGGISASRMRGIARKDGSGKLKMNEHRMIAASAAQEWLKGQSAFLPSIWKEGAGASGEGTGVIPDPIFIPVAADGSRFTPDLDTGNGYQIGSKGGHDRIHDYKEALQRLVHMEPPAWRRPAPRSGKMSAVVGVDWVRVSRASIGL